jgi:hypothetical protein
MRSRLGSAGRLLICCVSVAGAGGGIAAAAPSRAFFATASPASAFVIDPTAPATLYAAFRSGVGRTTDGGASWTPAGAGLTSTDVRVLAVDPAAPLTLYAGTARGVFKTVDAGASWSPANAGLAIGAFTPLSVTALTVDPSAPSTLWVAAATRSTYPVTDVGVFKSIDGAATWTEASAGLVSRLDFVRVLAVDPADGDVVYAANGDIWKTVDGGGTWHAIGPAFTYVYDLALGPGTPAIVWAANFNGSAPDGVLKSIDAGDTWEPTGPSAKNIAVDPSAPSTLYATAGVHADALLSRSGDAGGTWSDYGTGLSDVPDIIAVDPSDPARVYASTASALYTLLPVCAPAPLVRCHRTATRKGSVALYRTADGGRESFSAKWRSPPLTAIGEFGEFTLEHLSVCVYDQAGLRLGVIALAGACGEEPCWIRKGNDWKYKGGSLDPSGITNLGLSGAARASGSTISVKAAGAAVGVPVLPLVPPVRVEFVVNAGQRCWDTSVSAPARNGPTSFKGRSD